MNHRQWLRCREWLNIVSAHNSKMIHNIECWAHAMNLNKETFFVFRYEISIFRIMIETVIVRRKSYEKLFTRHESQSSACDSSWNRTEPCWFAKCIEWWQWLMSHVVRPFYRTNHYTIIHTPSLKSRTSPLINVNEFSKMSNTILIKLYVWLVATHMCFVCVCVIDPVCWCGFAVSLQLLQRTTDNAPMCANTLQT